MRLAPSILLLIASSTGCGGGDRPNARDAADANDTGRTLPARTSTEQNLLLQVGTLPAGSPRTFGNVMVVAQPAYHAASGRTCRALQIAEPKRPAVQRLACTDGSAWFFVPDVLGLGGASE